MQIKVTPRGWTIYNNSNYIGDTTCQVVHYSWKTLNAMGYYSTDIPTTGDGETVQNNCLPDRVILKGFIVQ